MPSINRGLFLCQPEPVLQPELCAERLDRRAGRVVGRVPVHVARDRNGAVPQANW